MAQQFDHTWLIYNEVIDETIKNSASLQSDAVLTELKNYWLKHLSEHLQAQHIANAERANVKNEPLVKVKKEIPTFDPLNTGASPAVPAAPTSNVWSTIGTEKSNKMPPPGEHPSTNVWAGLNQTQQPPPAVSTEKNPAPAPDDDVEGVAERQGNPPPKVVVDVEENDEDDDGWGNWEDPEEIEVKQQKAKEDMQVAAAAKAAEATANVPVPEAQQLESALAQNPAIPKDDDFTTTLRTQYGTSNKAGFVDDPDDVNSDLEELSSLSDDEPEATDYIIGQCEELIKPGGRKAQVQGTWKISLRGGIASIGGREFLFDRLEANLEF